MLPGHTAVCLKSSIRVLASGDTCFFIFDTGVRKRESVQWFRL